MIEVQSLSRFYGTHRAVDNVTFRVGENTVVGLLGLNGAGKTTTLKVIAGLLTPSSGTVAIDGVDLATASVDFRKQIGFLPETPPLYTEMSVTEFLRYIGRLRGMSAEAVEVRIPEVIEKAHLHGYEHRLIDELSHGYRKRVGIAQVIIHKPRLVILDEPISGLDPKQIVEMREVVRGLSTESTVLVSSHILSEVQQTCHRVLVLNNGRLVADGTPNELAGRIAGATRITFLLAGDRDAAGEVFDSLDVVTHHAFGKSESGRFQVTVDLAEDQREALVAALVQAGVGIRVMDDAHDELEEIFMGLTQGGAA